MSDRMSMWRKSCKVYVRCRLERSCYGMVSISETVLAPYSYAHVSGTTNIHIGGCCDTAGYTVRSQEYARVWPEDLGC